MLIAKKHHFKFKKKLSFNKHLLKYGSLGLKLKYTVCIDAKKENLIKFLILKKLKKISKTKISILFYYKQNWNKTKLPLESRMGKGKGEICNSFSYYKSGSLFLEFKNLCLNDAFFLKNYLNKKTSLNFYLIF